MPTGAQASFGQQAGTAAAQLARCGSGGKAAQDEEWDVIVIGSGMGGLSAASTLSQTRGLRCLVLEQHWTPGGELPLLAFWLSVDCQQTHSPADIGWLQG